nr:dihydrolipoamide acetyltransferase family protein [Nocardioides thalensis]
MREFLLPDLGSGLVEAEVLEWHVAVGDRVSEGDDMVDVETAKSVISVPAPFDGVVSGLAGAPGTVLAVGAVLVTLQTDSRAEIDTPVPSDPVAGSGAADVPASSSRTVVPSGAQTTAGRDIDPGSEVRAFPLARRVARQHGLALTAVTGTGRGGVVTRADVEREVARRTAEAPVAPEVLAAERRRLSVTRRTIAERMSRAWREIPHITSHDHVDAEALLAARSALARAMGGPVPLEVLAVMALTRVLPEFPEFNATLDGDDLVLHASFDVAVAVDTPAGLVTPVLRGAERLGAAALTERITDLVTRARDRSLTPAELDGGSITLSNIGAAGGGSASVVPIVPPGTTAIVSLGRAEERPVVRDGAVVAGVRLPVDVSCDHRVIDGAAVRRFVGALRMRLEDPLTLLL